MDDGFKKEETMAWWGMKERYYTFDTHGFHFVVLDGNKKDVPWCWLYRRRTAKVVKK